MHKLIERIIHNKTHCYFISPHLDDAAFSAGELISYLSGKVPVTVINVFTEAGVDNTLSAKQFLKACSYKKAFKLFEDRVLEDREALASVSTEVVNLGFMDALWRKKVELSSLRKTASRFIKEFGMLYPTYRFHAVRGKIQEEDMLLMRDIEEKILKVIGNDANIQVFAPVGFGNHVDHIVVRDACMEIFGQDALYWGDMPYSFSSKLSNEFIKKNLLAEGSFKESTTSKEKLCSLYKSQVDHVMNNKNAFYQKELFFTSKRKEDDDLYRVMSSDSISEAFLNKWQTLWEKSEQKNYFNSPNWFIACKEIYNYSKFIVVSCYKKGELVGVLPLVEIKKYGIKTYNNPDPNFSDKSSLLLLEDSPEITARLLSALSFKGNFYIDELGRKEARDVTSYIPELAITETTTGYHFSIDDEWEDRMGQKQRKQIMKKIKKEGDSFTYKMYRGSADEILPLMKRIEARSPKIDKYKDIFTDSFLPSLYARMQKLGDEMFTVHLLSYKGLPICYRYGFICGDTYTDSNTAFIETSIALSPGRVLAYLMISELKKIGVNKVDFARGESRFKKEFTPYTYKQYSLFYSPDFWVMAWWKMSLVFKVYLQKNQKTFEFMRMVKNIFDEGFDGLIRYLIALREKTAKVKSYSYQNTQAV